MLKKNMELELLLLTLTALLHSFSFVPSSYYKFKDVGAKWLLSSRDSKPKGEISLKASRAMRAQANFNDYFPAFAVIVLITAHLDAFNAATLIASCAFLIARFVYFFFYIFDLKVLRMLSFFTSKISAIVYFTHLIFTALI